MRFLKSLVPLGARYYLKYSWHAAQDIIRSVKGPLPPRVPQKRHIQIGGGDFIAMGRSTVKLLSKHGLAPDMRVLDCGCGQGRIARGLLDYLSEDGEYIGFDLLKSGVEWCQKQYADIENFQFIYADVYNKRYNKKGQTNAADYRFPFPDNHFDYIVLTSVFTHMLKADVENYLSEIQRVMKPGANCFITWFILNDQSKEALNNKTAHIDFRYPVDTVSKTTVHKNPEAAIAYEENFTLSLYKMNGLDISDPILYGRWSNPSGGESYQDIVLATKR